METQNTKETYTKVYYEPIDEALIYEALPENEKIIQVSKTEDYTNRMENQNDRIVDILNKKYPDRDFSKSKWHYHDFGSYQEVNERLEYTYCEDCHELLEDKNEQCDCIPEDNDNLSMLW